jgi:hypothetical protein
MSPHAPELLAWGSGLRLLCLSFSVLGGAWVWTVWDYARHARTMAPLHWYMGYVPPEDAWSLQALNIEYARERPLSRQKQDGG